ncbi:MAG: aldose 1-epimerase family protein [Ruminiclostridium sp.]|nr:aldose 1-epimerase family protein [Ruminiclostridium sp.]MBQ8842563.1 aldose 1-epimerase family protein [Ruminiclostridium sp.]
MEVTLKNKNSTAKIITKGAELKSYIADGKELMWCADEKYWGKTSPFLFPMIGNLKNGKTIINGSEYAISKHGFARDNEFVLENSAENTAVFSFTSNNDTLKSYPFDFKITITYTLTDVLEISYAVTNNSKTKMPYCIGGHPAFACDKPFNSYKLIFEQNETVNSPVMNLETRMWGDNDRINRLQNNNEFPLEYSLFDNDCVYFDTIKSKSCSLVSGNEGVKVSWTGFETLGVWTPDHKEAPFICIEPWCGCDDYDTDSGIFSEKRGIQTASPGETKNYSITIAKI